jgi:chloramphenicol 3-O-phosphotransferase
MEYKGITEVRSQARLAMLNGHVSMESSLTTGKAKIMDDVWASVNCDEFLSVKGIELRKKTREFMTSIESKLVDY